MGVCRLDRHGQLAFGPAGHPCEQRDQRNAEHDGDKQFWDDVGERLRGVGLLPGWGRTVGRIRASLRLLQDVLEAPEPSAVEELLAVVHYERVNHGELSEEDAEAELALLEAVIEERPENPRRR